MSKVASPAPSLQWRQLSGSAFEDALSGVYDKHGTRIEPAWLLSPKLKYYFPRSCLVRGTDTRQFFLAVERSASNPTRWQAVALLEIANQEYEDSCVGIKYVTVHPEYRRQGLSMQLYGMLVEHLKANGLRLYRTRPGAETPAAFTEAVTRFLTEQGVDWYSRDPLAL